MSNMNRSLFGPRGPKDDDYGRHKRYDEEYDRYESQDYSDKKKKDDPDVVVKIECPDCCCKKDDKRWDKDDKCDKKDKCEKVCCPTDVALNAATGGAGPLPIITTLLADPISVVSVTLDADKMRKPSILLNFTGIISLPIGVSVTLNFEVLRIKNSGAPIKVGPTYTFSTIVTVLESESFAFQLFDADLDPGTYTYSVVLSTNSIIDITPGLTIVNATLSGLAVDKDR
jgi:hypothetical protein